MPRMTLRDLVGALVQNRNLGLQEFKWLNRHAKSTSELHAMLFRRRAGVPLQYILGTQPFGPLDLIVRPPVLIPRPETEAWALRLARHLFPSRFAQAHEPPLKILDLCTGTGCIPLLLSHMSLCTRSVRALGVDVSSKAVALAQENAERTGKHDEFHVSFIQADILRESFPSTLKDLGSGKRFSGWTLPVDVLTVNPPYIPLHEYDFLPSSVKDYEDPRALLGDPEMGREGRGLTFYHAIARLVRAETGIVKGDCGLVVLEVGHDQAREVVDIMMTEGGVRKTEVWKDPWGVERSVICTT